MSKIVFRIGMSAARTAGICLLTLTAAGHLFAQAMPETGRLRGTVTLGDAGTDTGAGIHGVTVRVVERNTSTITEEGGSYVVPDLPPGRYTVVARMDGFRDSAETVTLAAGATETVDFVLRLLGTREEITVTATGHEETVFDSFQTVSSLDSVQLAEEAHTSLGEVMENQPGVAKRSFGPGSSRPVIRGFDGDRILILQDGARTGALSSQSGDHGETLDVLGLEKLEVVKGPATLLYGSNAIGGVVNAISGHDHRHPGIRGNVTAVAGSNNAYGAGHAGFESGKGPWLIWAEGGGQSTGDYFTPLGEVPNSGTRLNNGNVGIGQVGDKRFFRLSYGIEDGTYGVPFASSFEGNDTAESEPIQLEFRRHNGALKFGSHKLAGILSGWESQLSYTNYRHLELEGDVPGTRFDNRQFGYRTTFEQRQGERLSGRFGFEGSFRKYRATGAEALTPPVAQGQFAAFTLEEVELSKARLQFGARLETNKYDPENLIDRRFTGVSGAAGVHVPLWQGGAFVANYTHSYRAPALEELYNRGPHVGNLTFELGNDNLERERADGIELSLRHSSSRMRFDAAFYDYMIRDFVFLAPTGEIEDGLRVARHTQGDARYRGAEVSAELGMLPSAWLQLSLDTVGAELTDTSTPLPRIPPLRGRVGVEWQYHNLRLKPELHLANRQTDTFPGETETAGYAVFNLSGSYTVPLQHSVHIFSAKAFNLGDRLYRNHLSFIKELAPEIGRGIQLSYTMRFF